MSSLWKFNYIEFYSPCLSSWLFFKKSFCQHSSTLSSKHGPRHAISSEGPKKIKTFLKNVAHHGWGTK